MGLGLCTFQRPSASPEQLAALTLAAAWEISVRPNGSPIAPYRFFFYTGGTDKDDDNAFLVECLRADECGTNEYSWIPRGKISDPVKDRRYRAGMMGVMNKFMF